MQHDWIQDRDNEIEPEAMFPKVRPPQSRGSVKGSRMNHLQLTSSNNTLRDKYPPHLVDATPDISREHLL